VLNLSQDGAGVTGTGTYVMEAGGAGTLQVVGTYHRPNVNLSFHYDFGPGFRLCRDGTRRLAHSGAIEQLRSAARAR